MTHATARRFVRTLALLAGGALAAACSSTGGATGGATAPGTPTSPTAAPIPTDWPPAVVGVTQLVSGILHLLTGIGWLFTCFGVVIAVPLVVLGISELVLYSRRTATAPAESPAAAQALPRLA